MYKPPKNPAIEALSKSHRERRINLSDLSAIKIDGQKFCAWCATTPLTGRKYKWCSPECSENAFAWANPQKEQALFFLLVRQDWKCNLCPLTWKGLAMEIYSRINPRDFSAGAPNFGKEYSRRLIDRLKWQVAWEKKPEVDHIVPIYKGGQALGLDNHQAICYSCHRTKTSKDLSGKRKIERPD